MIDQPQLEAMDENYFIGNHFTELPLELDGDDDDVLSYLMVGGELDRTSSLEFPLTHDDEQQHNTYSQPTELWVEVVPNGDEANSNHIDSSANHSVSSSSFPAHVTPNSSSSLTTPPSQLTLSSGLSITPELVSSRHAPGMHSSSSGSPHTLLSSGFNSESPQARDGDCCDIEMVVDHKGRGRNVSYLVKMKQHASLLWIVKRTNQTICPMAIGDYRRRTDKIRHRNRRSRLRNCSGESEARVCHLQET